MNKALKEELFYKEKNYSGLKQLLKNCTDARSFNMLGKIELINLNPDKAAEYFNKAGNIFGCAYTKFVTGDIEEARVLLTLIKDYSSASKWLLSLSDIITGEKKYIPTYFQIRNFYEQDLDMLFCYKQNQTIEMIIYNNHYFEKFNKEVYKYCARVLFNNKFIEHAKINIEKSLSIYYNDPESHFILGEIYLSEKKFEDAKKAYLKAIEVSSEYFPASLRLSELN